jgi:hypothetical protein
VQKWLAVAPWGGVLFFIVGALIIFCVICLILVVCKRRGRSSTVVVRPCVNISSGKQEWHMIFILPSLRMKVPVLCLLRLNAEQRDGSKVPTKFWVRLPDLLRPLGGINGASNQAIRKHLVGFAAAVPLEGRSGSRFCHIVVDNGAHYV